MRIFYLIVLLAAKSVFAQQPALIFAKGFGGGALDQSNSIAVDLNKNIYVAGEFNNTVDFDPGSGVSNLSSTGTMTDLFFAKYDASGNYLWAKSIGSAGRETVNSIAVDKSGNCYITGYFEGVADFNPGAGTTTLSPSGSSRDFYFAKYDALGNFLWAKNLNGGNTDIGNSLTLDSIGNLYITGYFSQTLDFDPGPGTALLSGNSQAIFFAKYDFQGNYVWAHSLESPGFNQGNSVTLDQNANVCITGFFSGTIDFDLGSGIASLTGSSGSVFFAKYDNDGNYMWANKIGVSSNINGYDIAIDEANHVLITGVFTGTKDFDPGVGTSTLTSNGFGDIFFAKYDENGNYLWAKNVGGSNWEEGYAIRTDKNNNFYITGYFSSATDFDPGLGVATLTTTGAPQIFIAKYDVNGNYSWAYSIGSSGNEEGSDLVIDANGDLYLTGFFSETVDFDFGAGTANLTAQNTSLDAFFAKYSLTTIIGLEEAQAKSNLIIVSPNPCQDKLNISIHKEIGNGKIIILDMLGQKIFQHEVVNGNNELLISGLAKGIYLYSITENNNQISCGKLMFE